MNSYVGRQLGSYQVLRLLGQGGFADVYLAEHIYLKTQAAIKVLHTHLTLEDREKFQQEALLIARLQHPHIIRVLDFGMTDAAPFLVIEYAPNGTMRQRVPKGSCLAPQELLPYVQQVAEALQYAHDQHVIHRDVKPENMLLSSNQEVKLSDFGIAVVSQSTLSQKTESTIIGTMAYMAPEQLQGKAKAATDQYALAVVAYEWLTGTRPFSGSYIELISQHLSSPLPPLDEQALGISHEVFLVLEKALAKDPQARFPQIQEFAQALERAFALAPTTSDQQDTPVAFVQSVQPPTAKKVAASAQTAISPGLPSLTPASPIVSTVNTRNNAVKNTTDVVTLMRSSSKKFGGCARNLAIGILVAALFLCILGVGSYGYLTQRNPPAQGIALAKNFMDGLQNHNYDQSYTSLSSLPFIGISHDDFIRQAQAEDHCYGQVTRYQETSAASPNGTQVYSYLVSRSKLTQPYHLHVTVAKDILGNWHVTDYNSDIATSQPVCH